MSRLTLSTEQIAVYDEFLPQGAFEALLPYVATAGLEIVHRDNWAKVWRLGDGFPLQGTRMSTYRTDTSLYQPDEKPRYPTGTPIDAFTEAVDRVIGAGLTRLTVSPAVYRQGCGLSLHRDRFGYSGSYTYFIHHDWNFHWGGHLLILDRRTEDPDGDGNPHDLHFLSDERQNRVATEPGIAVCILPKPNRLVFIAPEAHHMITRVDANAGDRARVSLVGFFTTTEGPRWHD